MPPRRYSNGFPIHRLPALPLGQVVQHMELPEILFILLSSQKFGARMKYHTKNIPVHLKATINQRKRFVEVKEPGKDWINFSNFWIKNQNALNTILSFFATSFRVRTISFDTNFDPKLSFKTLEHAKELGFKFYSVNWNLKVCGAVLAQKVLGMCSNVSKLEFHCSFYGFSYEKLQEFRMNRLHISSGNWITRENVYALRNVRHIELFDLKWSNSDFHSILTSWKACRLHFATIDMSTANSYFIQVGTVICGLFGERIPPNNEFHYNLVRTDGVRAKLQVGHCFVYLRVEKENRLPRLV